MEDKGNVFECLKLVFSLHNYSHMYQYSLMNQLHLLQHCDSELHPTINGLFLLKCSMIIFDTQLSPGFRFATGE